MPKQLIMMVGASGSGKSTESRKLLAEMSNSVRVNRDELRIMALHKWKGSLEDFILDSETAVVKQAAKHGYHIIIDDTNLTESTQKWWATLSKQIGYELVKREILTPLEVCVARDATRKDHTHIGRPAIEMQFLRGKFVDWSGMEVGIFDIDGTLADLTHRVDWLRKGGPCPNGCLQGWFRQTMTDVDYTTTPPTPIYDLKECPFCIDGKLKKKFHDEFYSRVGGDAPIDIVVRWAQEWYDDRPAGEKQRLLLIVSGRSPENQTYEKTRDWLAQHGVKYDHIYMRRAWHHGPDTEEKALILKNLLASGLTKSQIKFVVDDRPSVIQMWKDNGLTVIPVRGRDDDEFYAEIAKETDANPPNWKEVGPTFNKE